MKSLSTGVLVCILVLFIVSCKTEINQNQIFNKEFSETHVKLKVPDYYPEFFIPNDNPLTKEKIELGKKLFFDPILSRNKSVSCSSCHNPKMAFTDNLPIAKGVDEKLGFRNSISLSNLVLKNSFFHDGGVRTLELQVFVPFSTVEEFDLSVPEAIERLKNDSTYQKLFKKAYNKEPFVKGLTNSIAAFQRTLISANSKFDQYFYQNDTSIFNEEELSGFNLFFGKAKCSHCHNGFLFSNQEFYNVGLKVDEDVDAGLRRLTGLTEDIGKFKTPSLRNIAITAPYMHDGRFGSLKEVIAYFNKGGDMIENQSVEITPLNLLPKEVLQLEAFLLTLTDTSYCLDFGTKSIETELIQ